MPALKPTDHALSSNMVLSITARLDELKANIIDKTSVFSESSSRGVDEMFEWLHAVASATSQGPVLLVLTFADKVQSEVGLPGPLDCTSMHAQCCFYVQADWKTISTTLRKS